MRMVPWKSSCLTTSIAQDAALVGRKKRADLRPRVFAEAALRVLITMGFGVSGGAVQTGGLGFLGRTVMPHGRSLASVDTRTTTIVSMGGTAAHSFGTVLAGTKDNVFC